MVGARTSGGLEDRPRSPADATGHGQPARTPREAGDGRDRRATRAGMATPPTSGRADGDRRPRQRRWPRWLPSPRVVLALILLAGLVVILLQARSAKHEALAAVNHLSWSRLPWLALAVGAEAVSFLCYALVQRRLLRAGGARLSRRTMVALAVAATGLTNLVPGGTAPASGWLVGQYRRRGVPMPLALWAVLAGGFAATVSVLALLLVGAAIAGLVGWVGAVGCGLALIAGATAIVAGVHRLPAVEGWLRRHRLRYGAQFVDKVMARTSPVAEFRTTVAGGSQVFALSLANWAMDILCLLASFALLGLPIPWSAVVFAYATAQVAGSLAPVPGGIGFVEGGMVGAFALAGTPVGNALVATIVYRVITCWAVAALGSLMLVVITHRQRERVHTGADRDDATTSGPAPVS
jgi:putative heme transporter